MDSSPADEWTRTNSSGLVTKFLDSNYIHSFGYPTQGQGKVTKYRSKIEFLVFFNLSIS